MLHMAVRFHAPQAARRPATYTRGASSASGRTRGSLFLTYICHRICCPLASCELINFVESIRIQVCVLTPVLCVSASFILLFILIYHLKENNF